MTTYEYFRGGALYVYNVVYENRWLLTGTAGSWFIIDVVFYANGLFSGQITTSMGYGDTIAHEAIAQLILQVNIIFDVNMFHFVLTCKCLYKCHR